MRSIFLSLLPAVSINFFAFDSLAHGGGLNAAGCHNNRKTGGYHCHRSGGYVPPQVKPTPSPQPKIKPSSARTICTDLGLTIGTERYEECVLLVLRNSQ